jgi:hypothetical protein
MSKKDTIEKEVLERIEEHSVTPKSKWHFVLKEWVLWTAVVVSVILGGMTFATALSVIEVSDWQLLLSSGMVSGAVIALPYFWLLLFAFSILLAQYNIRHTEKGYRIHVWMIAVWMIAGSLISGSLLYFAGGGTVIDSALEERVGVYGDWLAPRHAAWNHEEDGLLSGRVSEMVDDEILEIIDIEGDTWVILVSNDVEYRPKHARPFPGAVLRIVGEKIDEDTFEAKTIGVKPEQFRFRDHGRFEKKRR